MTHVDPLAWEVAAGAWVAWGGVAEPETAELGARLKARAGDSWVMWFDSAWVFVPARAGLPDFRHQAIAPTLATLQEIAELCGLDPFADGTG